LQKIALLSYMSPPVTHTVPMRVRGGAASGIFNRTVHWRNRIPYGAALVI
jgi:hypothetical protein